MPSGENACQLNNTTMNIGYTFDHIIIVHKISKMKIFLSSLPNHIIYNWHNILHIEPDNNSHVVLEDKVYLLYLGLFPCGALSRFYLAAASSTVLSVVE